jgi:hypothetical protein
MQLNQDGPSPSPSPLRRERRPRRKQIVFPALGLLCIAVVIGNYGCSIGFCRLSPWTRGEDGGEGFEACTTEMPKDTLTLPSPKPTLLPSLALARPSLPAGERMKRRFMRVQLVLLR